MLFAMNKYLLIASFLFVFTLDAQTWTGAGGDGLWATAGNWSSAPLNTTADNIIFNNGMTNTVIIPSTGVVVGTITVTANTTLILKSLSAAATIFAVNGSAGTDLVVNAGSALNLSSDYNGAGGAVSQSIQVNLATGATGSISGNMSFSNNPSTKAISHRLQALDANAITFQSGSVFSGDGGAQGNAFGAGASPSANSSIVFGSGSTYIQNGISANPFGSTAPNSVIVLQSGSNFIFKSTSGASFSNRTYDNLEIDVPTLTLTATTTLACNVNGNLVVTAGTLSATSTSGLNVKKDLTVSSGATLSIASGNILTLNCTAQQNITINGILSFGDATSQFKVFNSVGAKLNTNLTVRTFAHTSGKVILGNNNLVVQDNYNGGSSLSYVVTDGTGKFTVPILASAIDKVIHVGLSTGSYDPVTVTNDATAKSFEIKVSNTLPYGSLSSSPNVVKRVWDINRIGSGDLAKLSFTPGDLTTFAGGAFVPGSVVLGHGNGVTYDPIPATYSAGTFASTGPVTAFSPFITANDVALGVSLTSFDAQLTANNSVMLNWQTESEKDNSGFEIQRSVDAKDWQKIGFVKGKGQTNVGFDYNFEDKAPLSINYYRLKQIDFDGASSYSNIVNVLAKKSAGVFSIFPNPTKGKTATININEDLLDGTLTVINSIGSVVKRVNINSQNLNLDLSYLVNGLYIFEVQKGSNSSFQKVLLTE
jgi:Secretion system C-terminal sorting domain